LQRRTGAIVSRRPFPEKLRLTPQLGRDDGKGGVTLEFAVGPMSESILNVEGFVNERPMTGARWLVLALCFLVLVADGFHTAAMAFLAPALTHELFISRLALGPVLATSLIGLAVGALVAGPLADRYGRKRVLIASVAICSIGSLISASATGLYTLAVYRFITGTGIGAAMPNCTTLASEFVPAKRRALLLNIMFCGFPLGASTAGFLTAWLVPHFGWRYVFLAGGAVPLFLAAQLAGLPESISYMVVQKYPAETIKIALNKIAGRDRAALLRIAEASAFVTSENDAARGALPWKVMFESRFLLGTMMLWLTYFSGLFLYYLLTNWMPTLVRNAGYSISQASIVTALFPLGGVIGAAFCGWLMGRVNPTLVVSGAYFLTGVLLLLLARSTGSFGSLTLTTFLAGLAMNGAQTSMPVLAAASYPTFGRASGVAWMLGVGRIGGIAGAFGGGILLLLSLSLPQIISGLSAVAAVAGLALLYKNFASHKAATQTSLNRS
jgi:AAHS family 4-hydroxybenzoate transporter-like MFS transporter